MRRNVPCGRHAYVAAGAQKFATPIVLVIALAFSLFAVIPSGAARQGDSGFSPASGPAQVIAQGVVALPEGDAVWRTVRTRALLPQDALFEERPLGFVLASSGPLLLVDQESGEQVRLGAGEAAIVPAGTVQQRSSLGAQPVSYLSIELVGVDVPPPPADATVLQPGQPFPAPAGLHDLDLLSAALVAGEVFTIPDSGAKNVVLITDGAANVGRPGGEAVVLLAGEAASFSGELEVSVAADGGETQDVSFVVAMIGPEVPPPPGIAETPAATVAVGETPAPPTETAAATGTPVTPGQGAITVQVYTCPPGMDAETVAAAACAPTIEDFDIIVSGEKLESPLTLGDATAGEGSFTWSGLPFGDYLIAEAVLPVGATTYILSARNTTGDPDTGYRITLDEANPEQLVRIYNFSPD
ncbi:MAG: hypothetical protein K0S83_505 [Thermomicrobiales bacterium]|nr:hypothetical protein [Thermomicrobiales bacterium]